MSFPYPPHGSRARWRACPATRTAMIAARHRRSTIAGPVLLLLGLLALLAAGPTAAAPVFGEAVSLSQPDGTTVAARVWGDEFHQRLETPQGYTLVRDPD